jgi:hypothetical protein
MTIVSNFVSNSCSLVTQFEDGWRDGLCAGRAGRADPGRPGK